MLTRLKVRNFQSLQSVDLELGQLTVIVGRSSSGKTAVLRALKALTSNTRGATVITHGTTQASVEIDGQDARGDWSATWSRTATTGAYAVTEPGQEAREYTKLGGAVPAPVAALLGIGDIGVPGALSPELCVAGQFDRPYLLDETGSKVAQTLGELTQVSVLFDAAREANRRKGTFSSTLKTRESDLTQIIAQLQEFKQLPAQIKKCDEAEQAIARALAARTAADRLRSLVESFATAKLLVDNSPPEVVVPDFEPVEYARTRAFLFRDLIRQVGEAKAAEQQAVKVGEEAGQAVLALEDALHKLLVATGQCPLCGQSTKGM